MLNALFYLTFAQVAVLPQASIPVAAQSTADIQAAFKLIERNYAGYLDKSSRYGPETLGSAQQAALTKAATAASLQAEDAVLLGYLTIFHDGHLFFEPTHRPVTSSAATQGQRAPTLRPSEAPTSQVLSGTTFLVKVPSFGPKYKANLAKIIEDNHDAIVERENLVIDVRGNHGGADDTYDSLLPLIYTKPFQQVGRDGLATKENAEAWGRIIKLIPKDNAALLAEVKKITHILETAPQGTFVEITSDKTIQFASPLPKPSKILILIDKVDASSAEQFLLDARQSSKVTLVGERTSGTLDYGDIRPFPLPSGKRILWIPTSRSRRLPANPIDGIGIAPDVTVVPAQTGSNDDTVLARALSILATQ